VVVILVSALFRWPDTLLYALLVAVAGPLLIVILSLPIALVNSPMSRFLKDPPLVMVMVFAPEPFAAAVHNQIFPHCVEP
jgi:zinc transporter ZupT